MENKEISLKITNEDESMLACVLIAICRALTKEQRKQVSTFLRMLGEHTMAAEKDNQNSELDAKLLSLAESAFGGADLAHDLLNALKFLPTRVQPEDQSRNLRADL